jgi:hypothetical protein
MHKIKCTFVKCSEKDEKAQAQSGHFSQQMKNILPLCQPYFLEGCYKNVTILSKHYCR